MGKVIRLQQTLIILASMLAALKTIDEVIQHFKGRVRKTGPSRDEDRDPGPTRLIVIGERPAAP